jgi:hypothetical protein
VWTDHLAVERRSQVAWAELCAHGGERRTRLLPVSLAPRACRVVNWAPMKARAAGPKTTTGRTRTSAKSMSTKRGTKTGRKPARGSKARLPNRVALTPETRTTVFESASARRAPPSAPTEAEHHDLARLSAGFDVTGDAFPRVPLALKTSSPDTYTGIGLTAEKTKMQREEFEGAIRQTGAVPLSTPAVTIGGVTYTLGTIWDPETWGGNSWVAVTLVNAQNRAAMIADGGTIDYPVTQACVYQTGSTLFIESIPNDRERWSGRPMTGQYTRVDLKPKP